MRVNSSFRRAFVSSSRPGMSLADATLLRRSLASALLNVAISSAVIGSGISFTKFREAERLPGSLREEGAEVVRLEGRPLRRSLDRSSVLADRRSSFSASDESSLGASSSSSPPSPSATHGLSGSSSPLPWLVWPSYFRFKR